MTTFQTDNQVILFSEKFGLITDNQVIINRGAQKNKVSINSINKVNLFKIRAFHSNIISFLFSLSVLIYAYIMFKSEQIYIFYGLVIVGLIFLAFSFLHKFYIYRLIIKEKDNSIIEVKTTQINRKCIKEFYNAIVKKMQKK